MKANEFIKKFGWDEAIKALKNKPPSADYYHFTGGYERTCKIKDWQPSENLVLCSDLKRLVESWELVGRYGTAGEAKEYLPMLRMDSYDELKQAIADVESCQQ